MRINTNVSALNAHRNLSQTQASSSESMAKLSSGFRINKAADDAAGLGIANVLRASTRSLVQAGRNAEQANSLLQVAEGATGTVQKMLERMKELATQAGSDTVDTAGRSRIQAEFSQLREEITRTVDTTKFQGGHLLKSVAAQAANPGSPAVAGTPAVAGSTHTNQAFAVGTGTANDSTVSGNGTYTGSGSELTVRRNGAGDGWEVSQNGTDFSAVANGAEVAGITLTITDGATAAAANTTFTLAVTAPQAEVPGTPEVPATDAVEASGGPRSFLVSSSGAYGTDDLVTISGIDLTVSTLGIDSSDLSTAEGARTALTTIDDAIAQVNVVLGEIGASQNRIGYAMDNVKTAVQNFSAAESVIRDVDMAEEMTKFSKANILSQAGTAMLAQANQSSQGVLQLLRG